MCSEIDLNHYLTRYLVLALICDFCDVLQILRHGLTPHSYWVSHMTPLLPIPLNALVFLDDYFVPFPAEIAVFSNGGLGAIAAVCEIQDDFRRRKRRKRDRSI